MSQSTQSRLSSLVIYEVFVRNHGRTGSFAEVADDLERIRSMGVDVVWLMPIHPIGTAKRKGALGSPYAIADYRALNPEYGSERDFVDLLDRAHAFEMKVMIDVVYNHTAYDSLLMRDHPEYYRRDRAGRPVSMVPEWNDVIDLDYPNQALERYLIDSLLHWSRLGVDGFRCDVAPRVPVEFWKRAREEVGAVTPETLWLAESEHLVVIAARRRARLNAHSDAELYAAFDLEYDYDIWPAFQAAVIGRIPTLRYLELLRMQENLYPAGATKMRCVENHDQRRIMSLAPTRSRALAWTAFEAFNRGAMLIYGGQESGARRTPSLFDRDPVEWGNYELQDFLTRLARFKKDPAVTGGEFRVVGTAPAVTASWESDVECLLGVFNVDGASGRVAVGIPDGDYEDVLGSGTVSVRGGESKVPDAACIVRYSHPLHREWFYSDLMDFHAPADVELHAGMV